MVVISVGHYPLRSLLGMDGVGAFHRTRVRRRGGLEMIWLLPLLLFSVFVGVLVWVENE